MILYAETSAVLRWVLGAPDSASIVKTLASAEEVFASRLTVVEAERVIVRQLAEEALTELQAAEAQGLLARAAPHWRIVELTRPICERAGQRFPVEPVRTLDALHLATVLFAARQVPDIVVLATDERVLRNVDRLGLKHLGR